AENDAAGRGRLEEGQRVEGREREGSGIGGLRHGAFSTRVPGMLVIGASAARSASSVSPARRRTVASLTRSPICSTEMGFPASNISVFARLSPRTSTGLPPAPGTVALITLGHPSAPRGSVPGFAIRSSARACKRGERSPVGHQETDAEVLFLGVERHPINAAKTGVS